MYLIFMLLQIRSEDYFPILYYTRQTKTVFYLYFSNVANPWELLISMVVCTIKKKIVIKSTIIL